MSMDKSGDKTAALHSTLSRAQRRTILAAVAIGTFMSALDSSVVNIAMPKMSSYFNEPLSSIEWVVMAYLLIISSLLLTYGRLGDMYGHKRIYITGFIIFTAGSALCGASASVVLLIASRVIQAVGAGMLMSMGPAIVTDITPPAERGRALGVTAVSVSVALAAGPVLGGILTTNFGWQSIFYINLPVGIAGSIWAWRVIPKKGKQENQIFDIRGAAIIFIALVCILMPLSYTEKLGWESPYIIVSLAAGIMLMVLFVFFEKHTEYPMVDISLFNDRLFSMSNLSALLNYMANFSVVLLMPFYLQQLRGLDPSQAGLLIILLPLTTMLVAPISGALSDRVDSRYISSAGMAIAAFGIWQLSRLKVDSSSISIILALVTFGLGSGMFQTPNNSAIMGSVPGNRRGIASGMLATMRNIGMVLGVAVSGAIFTSRMNYLNEYLPQKGITGANLAVLSFTGALNLAYTVAAVLALAAVVTSLVRGSTRRG
jgi:EmrB/QacA subfamily drug resistance transporter